MTYDGLVLAAVAAELKRSLHGGHIQGVRQHNESDLTIDVRSHGKSYLLFMSVHPQFARVYLTASKLPVPQEPPNFCMLLRKHIGGSYITGIEQVGFDRILRIHTEAPDGNRNVLILELMGKHSNIILVSDADRILGAVKNISSAVSRYRQVLPGRDYMPPPGGSKASPIEISREDFDALWRDGLGEDPSADLVSHWLIAVFNGVGPFLAQEIMLRAASPTPDPIWNVLLELRRVVINQDYEPRLITDDRGSAVYAYPVPVLHYPSPNQFHRQSMNETLDTLLRDVIRRDAFDSESAGLLTSIKRSIAWREQTLRDLEKAIGEGDKSERYKEFGELIVASAGTIVKGQKSVGVVDYYDPEMRQVEIPLDEKLSPKENAERYFRRFRKARDGAAAASDRLKETRLELAVLKSAQERLPTATAVEDLRALRSTLTDKGLLRAEPRPVAPGKREESEFGTAKIRRMTSGDGFEILYGENSQSNDYLTTKVAKPNDWWLHARSITGAHVVIRTANRPDAVPLSTIRQAAAIAAGHSDAKHSSLVPVDYTLRKFVRKPRAAAPGLVTYQREKTIDVTPEGR